MDDLVRELTHLGLTAKEAAVYLATVELGPSVAQDISKKAKVNRATTYVMIDTLKGRGLISSFSKGKKKIFVAESPDRLLSMIRLQRQELEGKEAEFAGILPELMAMYNVEGNKPQVRFLEGLEGMKTIGQELQQIEGEAISIVPFDLAHDFMSRIKGVSDKEDWKFVESEAVPTRALLVIKDEGLLESAPDNLTNTKLRVLPFEKFPIYGEIVVRKDRIVMFSYKSALVSMVITSQVLADTYRALFDLAWVGAKEYPGNDFVKKVKKSKK